MKLFSIPVVVAVTVFGFANFSSAADQPGALAIPAAVEEFRGCATCNSAASACNSCGKVKSHCFGLHCRKSCTPYQTTLCPGACFGYFQTQWHRWENVCPIPYQGVGLTDTPVRAAPPAIPVAPKTTGSDVPLPKSLPMIPTVPGK